MKKILIIILCLFVVCGCNKENKTNANKHDKKLISKSNSKRKEYYVSLVNYVNHDDYLKEETNKKNTTYSNEEKVSNNKEEILYSVNDDLNSKIEIIKEESKAEIDIDTKNNTILNYEDEIVDIKENIDVVEKEEIEVKETEKEETEKLVDSKVIKESDKENISNLDNLINDEVIEENKVEDIKKGYYSATGKYLGESKVKVIDVSYYQGDINWDLFASESDCYGVILRLGYYDILDKKFEENIKELKRLNIPYGIYLFSYSTTINGSNKEANFTNKMIDKYDLKPSLGIYYDIESWSASNGASSNEISKDMYDKIIVNYINKVSLHINDQYKVKVYSGRWYAENKLGSISKNFVDWVAEYNSTCKYNGVYSMWQYTSKGSVAGISTNVDISFLN